MEPAKKQNPEVGSNRVLSLMLESVVPKVISSSLLVLVFGYLVWQTLVNESMDVYLPTSIELSVWKILALYVHAIALGIYIESLWKVFRNYYGRVQRLESGEGREDREGIQNGQAYQGTELLFTAFLLGWGMVVWGLIGTGIFVFARWAWYWQATFLLVFWMISYIYAVFFRTRCSNLIARQGDLGRENTTHLGGTDGMLGWLRGQTGLTIGGVLVVVVGLVVFLMVSVLLLKKAWFSDPAFAGDEIGIVIAPFEPLERTSFGRDRSLPDYQALLYYRFDKALTTLEAEHPDLKDEFSKIKIVRGRQMLRGGHRAAEDLAAGTKAHMVIWGACPPTQLFSTQGGKSTEQDIPEAGWLTVWIGNQVNLSNLISYADLRSAPTGVNQLPAPVLTRIASGHYLGKVNDYPAEFWLLMLVANQMLKEGKGDQALGLVGEALDHYKITSTDQIEEAKKIVSIAVPLSKNVGEIKYSIGRLLSVPNEAIDEAGEVGLAIVRARAEWAAGHFGNALKIVRQLNWQAQEFSRADRAEAAYIWSVCTWNLMQTNADSNGAIEEATQKAKLAATLEPQNMEYQMLYYLLMFRERSDSLHDADIDDFRKALNRLNVPPENAYERRVAYMAGVANYNLAYALSRDVKRIQDCHKAYAQADRLFRYALCDAKNEHWAGYSQDMLARMIVLSDYLMHQHVPDSTKWARKLLTYERFLKGKVNRRRFADLLAGLGVQNVAYLSSEAQRIGGTAESESPCALAD